MGYFYTGVGSRETPPDVLRAMESASFRLARIGFTLRSGKAGGADRAFQIGMQNYFATLDEIVQNAFRHQYAEIYTPWSGFQSNDEVLLDDWDISLNHLDFMIPEQIPERTKLVEEIHPNFEALRNKRGPFAMHSRNMHQVLGANILEPRPSSFCLYYAKEDKNGNPKGGTASAVNLSKKYGIRTLNLNTPERLDTLEKFLTAMEKKRGIIE